MKFISDSPSFQLKKKRFTFSPSVHSCWGHSGGHPLPIKVTVQGYPLTGGEIMSQHDDETLRASSMAHPPSLHYDRLPELLF